AVRALSLGIGEHLVAGHVDDLRLGVDELADQPRTGDPVGLRMLTGDPLHGVFLLQAGSRPSIWAPCLNAYRPSNIGPVTSSTPSSSRVIERPRTSTSRPGASGASKRSSARSASWMIDRSRREQGRRARA